MEMLELAIIKKSESDWASSVVTRKELDPNGDPQLRFYTDYRELNKLVILTLSLFLELIS